MLTDSKSRDFPGRFFTKKSCRIIQDWAKLYRSGSKLFGPNAIFDNRVVQLPLNMSRRKPFRGATSITIVEAFYWMRLTHERLMMKQEQEVAVNDKRKAESAPSSLLLASSSLSSSSSSSSSSSTSSSTSTSPHPSSVLAMQNIVSYPISCLYPSTYVQHSNNRTEFIEVHFTDDAVKQLQQDFSGQENDMFRCHLCPGHNVPLVPINIQSRGFNAIFCAATIPIGMYQINGCTFQVLASGSEGHNKGHNKVQKGTAKRQKFTTTMSTALSPTVAGAVAAASDDLSGTTSSSNISDKHMFFSRESSLFVPLQDPVSTDTEQPEGGAPASLPHNLAHLVKALVPEIPPATNSIHEPVTAARDTARVISIDPNVVYVNGNNATTYVDLTFDRNEQSVSCVGGGGDLLPIPSFVRFSANQQIPVYHTDLGGAVIRAEDLRDGQYCVDGVVFQVCDVSLGPLQENELIWMEEDEEVKKEEDGGGNNGN